MFKNFIQPGMLGDWLNLLFSVLLVVCYQFFLYWKSKKQPNYTIQAVNRIARTAWVETVMAENRDMLAVQTLRNSTMAATFLASTSILLIMGVLNLSGHGGDLGGTWHGLSLVQSLNKETFSIKLMFLLSDLFASFFCFSMSIRIYTHVGYMINVPLNLNHKSITPQHVALQLNRAGKFYSLGMRAYYFIVPFIFWLFGSELLPLSTTLLIGVLFFLDRAPKLLSEDYAE
ncbi:MAG: DUF599 domain-containing protein [Betaproteobacteria bacterium]|nr:DUF599 domain-containing protein [Betaproteobacteria bacterium]